MAEPGGRGAQAPPLQILADQSTLNTPRGADYAPTFLLASKIFIPGATPAFGCL